jgi:RNA polymerase sigma factor (sigma-70 family)
MDTYFQEIRRQPYLEPEEEKELASRYQQGDQGAGNQLVTSHLRLVVKIARRLFHWSQEKKPHLVLDLDDMIQAGNLQLLRALEKFNPELGTSFASCAAEWVRFAILKHIKDQDDYRKHISRSLNEPGRVNPDEQLQDEQETRTPDTPLTAKVEALRGHLEDCRQNLGPEELDVLDSRLLTDEWDNITDVAARHCMDTRRVHRLQRRLFVDLSDHLHRVMDAGD